MSSPRGGTTPTAPAGKGTGWLLAQLLLTVVFFLIPEVIRLPGAPTPRLAIGFAILAGGLLLTLAGLAAMGSNLTPFPRPRRSAELVHDGVFRLVRHPIYGGMVIMAVAYAILRASLLHLIGAAVVLLFFDAKRRHEERFLEAKFAGYAEYKKKTRRLIPWLY